MPLARFDTPFEHPDLIFEAKMDGFRAVAYIERGICRLVSRNRNAFKTFEPLAQAIAEELAGGLPSWTGRSCDRDLVRAGVPEKVAMLISGHKSQGVFERYDVVDERTP